MTGHARSSLVAITAVALALALLSLPGWAQDQSDGVFDELASCFGEQDRLLVLALMDESGSLRRTDPDDRRVVALQTALTNLAELRSLAGEEATVEVALAGFGADFEMVRDWSDLSPQSVQEIRRQAVDFAQRDDGLDTDFALALEGAQSAIAERAAELTVDGEASPCRVLFLFTDGAYDIEPRRSGETKPYAPDLPLDEPGNAERVEELGKQLICEDGGLADTLRSTGVPLITVAFSAEIARSDQDFIEAMSSGRSSSSSCGSIHRPGNGAYIPAADLSELLAAFDRASGRMLGGRVLEGEDELSICSENACPEGTRSFELDPSLRQAHLLINLVAPGVVVELLGPSADEPLVIRAGESGSTEHSGAQLTVTPLGATDVVIDAALPPDRDDWVGRWSVTFIDTTGSNPGSVARAQIILFGALAPEVVGEPTFRLGQESTASVRVVDQEGTPRTPSDFVADAVVEALVTDPVTGSQQQLPVEGPNGDGDWTLAYTPPAGLEATAVNLSVTLTVTTSSGVVLQPRTTTVSVPVLPPATYPSVRPEQLELGTLVGSGEVTSALTVVGPESGTGCVWFEPGAVSKPRYAGDVEVTLVPDATSEGRCLQVAEGETREVTVVYRADEVASGSVEAPLGVSLRSDANPEVLRRQIPVVFEMLRPVNQAKRIGLFLALLLPGLLLPFALMYVLNWWTARFKDPSNTRHAQVPVRVLADGRIERQNGGGWRPFDLTARDFVPFEAPADDVRQFDSAGLAFEARTPLNPFSAPYGVAAAEAPFALGSDGGVDGDSGGLARVPFALPGSWVFEARRVADADDGATAEVPYQVEGDLHVWLDEAPFAEQGPPVIDRVRDSLGDPVQRHAADLWQVQERDEQATNEAAPADDAGGYSPPGSRGHGDYRPPGDASGTPYRPGGGSAAAPPRRPDDDDGGSPPAWTPPKS